MFQKEETKQKWAQILIFIGAQNSPRDWSLLGDVLLGEHCE